MSVPFLDLSTQHAPIRGELDHAIGRVIDESAFASGPFVEEFEEAFAAYTNTEHCVAVNSGTSALHLALLARGVGPGDEVITTPHTWISTTWAITYCGATPVYVDVDPDTGNLAPEAVAAAITDRTKVLLPVDLYGNPADHVAFERLAKQFEIDLIDDAAQSHGATLNGRPIGSFGRATCFSFYPGKNLGALGEGGAVVTDDSELAARIRLLRDHAQSGRHNHVEIGFNARMDGIQGAVLTVKLRHIDGWNESRRAAAKTYLELLSRLDKVAVPVPTAGAEPSWHLFPIRIDDRDAVANRLAAEGIQTGIHYPTPVHLQPAYRHLGYRSGSFPHAERYASTCLSLPMFPGLSLDQQSSVVENLKTILEDPR